MYFIHTLENYSAISHHTVCMYVMQQLLLFILLCICEVNEIFKYQMDINMRVLVLLCDVNEVFNTNGSKYERDLSLCDVNEIFKYQWI